MKWMFAKCNSAIVEIVILLAIGIGAQAQQPDLAALMAGMAANGAQLRQYTFKQRTEAYYKDELKNVRVDEVHYSLAGERVSIPLEEQKEQPQQPPRPLRLHPAARLVSNRIERKQAEIKDYVERLLSLAGRYLSPEQAKLQAALANAQISLPAGGAEVRISLLGFIKPGDSLTMSFDSATRRPTRSEARTSLDDKPVTIAVTFDAVHSGPNYPARIVVTLDSEQLEVRMLTYDYRL